MHSPGEGLDHHQRSGGIRSHLRKLVFIDHQQTREGPDSFVGESLNDGTCLKLSWIIGDAEERNACCTEQHLVILRVPSGLIRHCSNDTAAVAL